MSISLIWAMTDDRVIGIDNRLPWRLPADMKWFRQHTLGKTVIMGRRTFESLAKKPLPDRRNIVITKQTDYQTDNVIIASSVDAAIAFVDSDYLNDDSICNGLVDNGLVDNVSVKNTSEIMIIGGASLYAQCLERADRLYVTLVHAQIEGDAWFPEFDLSPWQEIERHDYDLDAKNPYSHSFIIMERAKISTENNDN